MAKKIYYVPSSHWDREWYQTFQHYRHRLVGLFDQILDCQKTGKLNGPFYTDGQACMLEDYLEIRPDRKDTLKDKLKNGQLISGPWYVLPDEFLVSGESLVRNLQLGLKTVREFGGKPSKTGFLCDMFGHISQMPQLFDLFGIRGCTIWRGVNLGSRLMQWEGADGTVQPTYAFSNYGYGEYAFVRGAGQIYDPFDEKVFFQKLKDFIDNESAKLPLDSILLFDGLDHQYFDEQAYKSLRRYCSDHGIKFQHTGLDEYFRHIEKNISKIKPRIQGQLRQVLEDYKIGGHLIFGVLSSRADIKQENASCENTLCGWAEPYSVIAELSTRKEYPHGFLAVAWKWLIKNHPHDSICGCSIDQVHEDMKYRFSQTRQIADKIAEESLTAVALNTDCPIDDRQLKLAIFNPAPTERRGGVTLDVDIPQEWPFFEEFFGYEKIPAFRIFDAAGNEIPYQRIHQQSALNPVIQGLKMPSTWNSTRLTVAIEVDVPPMGYTTLIIKQANPSEPVRHPSADNISKTANSLENDVLKLTVEKDGSLTVLDKRTKQTYTDLLTFEDTADIGDGWFHGMAVNDQTYHSIGAPSQVSLVANGPELATLKITKIMRVPESFSFSSMHRSSAVKEFTIDSHVTLRKGSDRIEIQTQVDNNIKDHRLRVLFPTHGKADTFLADSVFDVIEYPVAIASDNYKKKELQTDTRPQQNWSAISDTKRGLAILSPGQYETAISDSPDRTLKLTLFRSTCKTVMTTGEPGGQLLKPLTFTYCIVPLQGPIDRLKLYDDASRLAHGVKTIQLRKQDLDIRRAVITQKLPPRQGHLSVKNAVMTSFRKHDKHIELRVFNPDDKIRSAAIKLLSAPMKTLRSAVVVNLEGRPCGKPLKLTNGSLTLKLKPKQIVTLRLT